MLKIWKPLLMTRMFFFDLVALLKDSESMTSEAVVRSLRDLTLNAQNRGSNW